MRLSSTFVGTCLLCHLHASAGAAALPDRAQPPQSGPQRVRSSLLIAAASDDDNRGRATTTTATSLGNRLSGSDGGPPAMGDELALPLIGAGLSIGAALRFYQRRGSSAKKSSILGWRGSRRDAVAAAAGMAAIRPEDASAAETEGDGRVYVTSTTHEMAPILHADDEWMACIMKQTELDTMDFEIGMMPLRDINAAIETCGVALGRSRASISACLLRPRGVLRGLGSSGDDVVTMVKRRKAHSSASPAATPPRTAAAGVNGDDGRVGVRGRREQAPDDGSGDRYSVASSYADELLRGDALQRHVREALFNAKSGTAGKAPVSGAGVALRKRP